VRIPAGDIRGFQGALSNLNHRVGRGTIANVLKRSGIEPSPERGKRTPWSTFLKAHWKVLFAADFMTTEVWTARGLVTHYLLSIASDRIHSRISWLGLVSDVSAGAISLSN